MTALAETGFLTKERIRMEKNPTECQMLSIAFVS